MLSSVAALCALLGSCGTLPRARLVGSGGAAPAEQASARFQAIPFSALPGWSNDAPSAALPSFAASCRTLIARGESAAIWRPACAAASPVAAHDDAGARAFFEAQFTPYRVTTADGIDVGRVTGYYEPLLKGSRARNDRYRYPLYAPPDDLLTVELGEIFPELKSERVRGRLDGKRVMPYWSRAEIEAGHARLSGRELVWVDDPVEAFFVHIQGSARVELADRSTVKHRCRASRPGDGNIRTNCHRFSMKIQVMSFSARSPPILITPSMVRSAHWACRLPRTAPSRWIHAFCRWVHHFFWRRLTRYPMRACSGWFSRRTPAARSEARYVPISSGALATTRDETRAG